MSKRAKVTFSLILVFCLLLSGLPSAFPVAATEADEPLTSPITESTVTEPQAVAEQSTAVTEEIPVLQLDADCQILNHVDPEVFAAGNHIARLPEEETLSSYVFLNVDGTKTVYYMDQPVKFENADGTVVEKNLTLTAATEGYTTTQNDIQLTIPMNPTNGIRLVYNNHAITLIPQGGTLTNAAQATDSSVTYPDYYGEGMSLRYTPTLSGVKEDILLDAYSGVNSFNFRLNTGGLNLYQANGRYFLAESKVSTERIELGEVVTYDAKSKFSIGTMTAQTIMAGQAYMLTLTVDEAFLTDENTTYPVTIDPTLTVSYGNDGDNYIIDAPIFEGYPNNNYGAFQYNRVGYVDSSYQSGRTVVKLPVLTSSSIYSSLTADNITSVKFYVKEATGSSGIPVVLYPLTTNSTWTETSVTWNNVGSRSSTALAEAVLTDSAWSAFDITTLVQLWKSGGYNANCGFIMIGTAENGSDKSFCSSEHEKTSYRPYVVMTYNSGISLNYSAVNVDEGKSFTITATTSPAGQAVTWTSSDESVATVSSSGVVTTLKAGEVSIRATTADGKFSSCTVYVTVADGVYRICQSGLYLGTSGSISEHTSAELLVGQTSGVTYLAQLWKIKYISAGYYSIRPMHKPNMALDNTSGNVDIVSDGGSDALVGGSFSNRWGINHYNDKYILKSAKSAGNALRCTAVYPGADILTEAYSASNSNFHWTLDSSPSGVVLYDTSTNCAVTNPTRYMAVGETKSISALNLQAVSYSASTNSTSFTWTITGTSATINQNTGAVTGVAAGNATITGRIFLNGTYHYVNYTIEVSNLLIYQTEKTYYYDADGNYAADLVCGDMSKDDLRALDWVSWADFEGYTPSLHRLDWEYMCTDLFSTGELETVILDMIDHFMEGSGSPYSNSVLTQKAYEHDSTQEYINKIKERLGLLLNAYDGDIAALAYSADTRDSNPLVQALKANEVYQPVYNTTSDKVNGLTICIDGLWGNKIEVSSYSINGSSYSCTLHYTLYDHFGLDQPDVEKYGPLAGFRSWYVLQHYSEYNSAYKPFLTVIEFDVTISGPI